MIKVRVVVYYIGLNQKWSAAKLEMTNDHIVLIRKLFINFCKNLYCDSFDILFPYPEIQMWVEYLLNHFL